MSFEMEARVSQLMRNMERNIEVATQNPDMVLRTQFKGVSPSGNITIWSDALGRVERVSLAPGAVRDGAESFIADEFLAATSNARAAAERLDPDGTDREDSQGTSNRQGNDRREDDWEDETFWNDGGSFLR